MKQIILDSVKDLVTDFLYYDRKEDEDFPVGEIEKAIKANEITVEEIISVFSEEILNYIKD